MESDIFFLLSKNVFVKERLLKVDECTLNKLRLDYSLIMMNINILEEK